MFIDQNAIKVSFEKPRYETNGNQVKCTLNYRICVPFANHEENPMTMKGYNPTAKNITLLFDLGEKHSAVGTAVCSPEDEFDKKLGREIAEARAEAKAYKHASKLVKKYVRDVVTKYADMSLEFEAKADYVNRHNAEYVEELGK